MPYNPSVTASPCHPQAPFVCFADIFPANGEIYPLHKGGFVAYNNFTNYAASICKWERNIPADQKKKKRCRGTASIILRNYMVIRQKRRTNSRAITVTAMSFFLYLPVHRVIRV